MYIIPVLHDIVYLVSFSNYQLHVGMYVNIGGTIATIVMTPFESDGHICHWPPQW